MTEKKFPFYCEWCGKIKEGIGQKREIDITNFTVDVEPTPLTVEEIVEIVSQMGSNPHYMCADCVRRELGKNRHA